MELLEQMKVDSNFQKEVEKILNAADRYCNESPVTIADNPQVFEPNKHYYCSVGPYWWPDSLQGGKYINKDGIVNPESLNYDCSK